MTRPIGAWTRAWLRLEPAIHAVGKNFAGTGLAAPKGLTHRQHGVANQAGTLERRLAEPRTEETALLSRHLAIPKEVLHRCWAFGDAFQRALIADAVGFWPAAYMRFYSASLCCRQSVLFHRRGGNKRLALQPDRA